MRPILVGLSIGGLFAARAHLGGAPADGLVLINTLRRDTPRLRWINDAVVRAAEVGGLQLFQDLFAPLVFNEEWQQANRGAFLTHDAYEPMSRASGLYNLLLHAGSADWDLPYEELALPVLVVSGAAGPGLLRPGHGRRAQRASARRAAARHARRRSHGSGGEASGLNCRFDRLCPLPTRTGNRRPHRMTSPHRYVWLAYIAVLLGVVGHSSSEFVAVLTGVAGPELSVWRFLLGGAGLVILALIFPASRDLIAPLRKLGFRLIGLSLLGVSTAYLFFHWALDYATVIQVAIMTTTMPLWVALINLALNRQPITAPKVITGAAAIIGVALLVTDGYLARLAGTTENLTGILMAGACSALGSAYIVIVRPVIAEFGALRITALTMAIGAIGLWLIVGAGWGIWVNPATVLDRGASELAALLTLALWNTTITQFLWLKGLANVPDLTRGSYLFFLKPPIAAFLAVVFLGHLLTWPQVLAILVICGAVATEAFWPQIRVLVGRPAVGQGKSAE